MQGLWKILQWLPLWRHTMTSSKWTHSGVKMLKFLLFAVLRVKHWITYDLHLHTYHLHFTNNYYKAHAHFRLKRKCNCISINYDIPASWPARLRMVVVARSLHSRLDTWPVANSLVRSRRQRRPEVHGLTHHVDENAQTASLHVRSIRRAVGHGSCVRLSDEDVRACGRSSGPDCRRSRLWCGHVWGTLGGQHRSETGKLLDAFHRLSTMWRHHALLRRARCRKRFLFFPRCFRNVELF